MFRHLFKMLDPYRFCRLILPIFSFVLFYSKVKRRGTMCWDTRCMLRSFIEKCWQLVFDKWVDSTIILRIWWQPLRTHSDTSISVFSLVCEVTRQSGLLSSAVNSLLSLKCWFYSHTDLDIVESSYIFLRTSEISAVVLPKCWQNLILQRCSWKFIFLPYQNKVD